MAMKKNHAVNKSGKTGRFVSGTLDKSNSATVLQGEESSDNKTHSVKIARSATTGRISSKPLGRSKASKFSEVEGIMLSFGSRKVMVDLEIRGLKGDALRSAISGSFQKKQR